MCFPSACSCLHQQQSASQHQWFTDSSLKSLMFREKYYQQYKGIFHKKTITRPKSAVNSPGSLSYRPVIWIHDRLSNGRWDLVWLVPRLLDAMFVTVIWLQVAFLMRSILSISLRASMLNLQLQRLLGSSRSPWTSLILSCILISVIMNSKSKTGFCHCTFLNSLFPRSSSLWSPYKAQRRPCILSHFGGVTVF